MGTFEDYGTKCTFYYAMFKYGPHRFMCLNKPMGAREWNVMFVYAWPWEWHY